MENKPTLGEQIADILVLFYRKRMIAPPCGLADHILGLIVKELDGLTVMGMDNIHEAEYLATTDEPCYWEMNELEQRNLKRKAIAQAQLSRTIKELKERLGIISMLKL